MNSKRLLTLQGCLLLGLGAVFMLPKKIEIQPAAIGKELPTFVGEWYGVDQPVSQGERESLGPDTQFAKKLYTDARGDQIFVSIVFSGPDMATSIHRPERCLPAQGWTTTGRTIAEFPVGDKRLKVTRLHNLRTFRNETGPAVSVYSLNYYWFVGHETRTPSHYERTWIDIRDRVLKGENQQWAYVFVMSTITKDIQRFGKSEAQTDEMIQNFIRQLLPDLEQVSPQRSASLWRTNPSS